MDSIIWEKVHFPGDEGKKIKENEDARTQLLKDLEVKVAQPAASSSSEADMYSGASYL